MTRSTLLSDPLLSRDDYRLWTLEQLAAATTYLLGPNEPMLAGEATIMPPELVGNSSKRDLAVVVTATHVLGFR
jgi:hypothetical protein